MVFAYLLAAQLLAAQLFPPPPSLIVSAERTPIAVDALRGVLLEGHRRALGREPSRCRLAMGLALVRYENGWGRQVFWFNLGNVGPTRGQVRFLLRDGGYYARFASAEEGAAALWSRLAAWCPGALQYFDAALPLEAGMGLRRCGYHRTDARYGLALKALFGQALSGR